MLRIEALLLLLWIPLSAAMATSASPRLGEALEYTLDFRGVVTGFIDLDIAKLTLSVEPVMEDVAGQSAYVTRLQLTTEPYTKAEMIYPVRLDYRSWLDSQTLQPLLATKSLQTRESKRELFWFDRQAGDGHVYRAADASKASKRVAPDGDPPPDYLRQVAALSEASWAGLLQTKQMRLVDDGVLDYMGMLHQLRHLDYRPGETLRFTVFTGKDFEYYQAKVAKERLVRGGWDRPALRLRLFEYDPKEDKLKDEIKLWLSDDDERLLLRFYAERTIGALEGILDTGRPQNGRHDKVPAATERSLKRYLGF